jgi:hypothetical protein
LPRWALNCVSTDLYFLGILGYRYEPLSLAHFNIFKKALSGKKLPTQVKKNSNNKEDLKLNVQ